MWCAAAPTTNKVRRLETSTSASAPVPAPAPAPAPASATARGRPLFEREEWGTAWGASSNTWGASNGHVGAGWNTFGNQANAEPEQPWDWAPSGWIVTVGNAGAHVSSEHQPQPEADDPYDQ